jgi:hypothetical protein
LASAIIGGAYNDITGRFSTIGGGFDNNVGDNFSFIGGGFNNEMPQFVSGNAGANIIGAGVNNSIDGGSSQSIIAGKYNTIEYDPPAISFGSYIDTIYDSSQRKVILDSKRFPLSAYLFGRNGTDAVIASEASSSTYDYTINNSKFGAIVQISEKILRGDEILRSTPYSWMHIEYGFYNDVSLTLYVIPSFNEGSESNYWAFGLAPNTIYDGWIYISNSYSNQGHWIWSESRSWMFIWNQATYPDFAGKYYSNDTNTNNNISL